MSSCSVPAPRCWLVLAVLVLLPAAVGCDSEGPPQVETPPDPIPFELTNDGFEGETFLDGLDLPSSIAFPPDGSNRLFINELQTGRVLIAKDGELLETPFVNLQTNVQGGFPVNGENGLTGITFDPNYESNGYVYLTFVQRTETDTLGAVARVTDVNNRGEDATILLDSIPSATSHQIQSPRFGPDEKLYVPVGDAFMSGTAQDTSALTGKILRMNRDGTIPADNPFPNSYTWSLGMRNCFDLAFNAEGKLFTACNGPSGNDELNKIQKGGNYGWPLASGTSPNDQFIDPIHVWPQIVSPTGMLFYRGAQFPQPFQGTLFQVLFGRTNTEGPSERAKRVQVASNLGTDPTFEDFLVYTTSGPGNPLDITVGPAGSLYLTDIFQGRVFKVSYTGN